MNLYRINFEDNSRTFIVADTLLKATENAEKYSLTPIEKVKRVEENITIIQPKHD